jgi:hypothetical protein
MEDELALQQVILLGSFGSRLLITISSLQGTRLLLPHELQNIPDQTAHYHIHSLWLWGFISDQETARLQSNGTEYFTTTLGYKQ